MEDEELDIEEFFDKMESLEFARTKLFCKITNAEKKKEMPQDVIYKDILDLTVGVHVMMMNTEDQIISVLVSKSYLRLWNISEEKLWEIAMKNTRKLFSVICIKIDEFVLQQFGREKKEEILGKAGEITPMYVLTNKKMQMGAIYLADQKQLRFIAKGLKDDLYILPYSIDEVIIIAKKDAIKFGLNKHKMHQMMLTKNQTVGEEGKFLSNHVYYYNLEQGLSIVI
mgnify:FL=1